MTTSTPFFSLIGFQEELIEKLHNIEACGCGLHTRRSRSAAYRKAAAELIRRGYTEKEAEFAVQQAHEVWKLERLAEEA